MFWIYGTIAGQTEAMADRIRVSIVDDHEVFRIGMKRLFERSSDLRVEWELGSGTELLATLATRPVDAVLLDFNLGPDQDSIALTRAVAERFPGIRVVMMSALVDRDAIMAAQAAGAVGYLAKDLPAQEMLDIVRHLLCVDGAPFSPGTFLRHSAAIAVGQVLDHGLTRREAQVLSELRSGRTNRQIAHRLGISKNTVNKHVHKVLEKLQVKNRAQAIARLDAEALGRAYRTIDVSSD